MVTKYLTLIVLSVYCAVGQTPNNEFDSQSSIKNEVNVVESKVNSSLKIFQENINRQLEATHQDSITWKSVVSRNIDELEQSIEKKLNDLKIRISELEENTNQKLDLIQTFISKSNCKEYLAESGLYRLSKIYPMEDEALHHVTLKKNNDNVMYFEMHVAIKAVDAVFMLLSPVPTPNAPNNDSVVAIGVGVSSNKNTVLYESFLDEPVKDVNTPNILSATHYESFYIKISNGTLVFGKEGDSTPVITYEDCRVSTFKYFAFSYLMNTQPKIFYDCPAL